MMMLLCVRLSADTEKDFHFQHINTKGYAVRVVYRDVNGVMWLGTTSGLLTLPQLTSRNPSSYHRTMSKVNMSIRNISGDGSGGLWIKTLYNNNYFYNPLRNEFVEDTSGMLLQKGVDVNSEFSVKAEAGDNTWIWKDNRIYWLPEGASKANMITVGADDQLCKLCRDGKNLMALSQNALYIISPEKNSLKRESCCRADITSVTTCSLLVTTRPGSGQKASRGDLTTDNG